MMNKSTLIKSLLVIVIGVLAGLMFGGRMTYTEALAFTRQTKPWLTIFSAGWVAALSISVGLASSSDSRLLGLRGIALALGSGALVLFIILGLGFAHHLDLSEIGSVVMWAGGLSFGFFILPVLGWQLIKRIVDQRDRHSSPERVTSTSERPFQILLVSVIAWLLAPVLLGMGVLFISKAIDNGGSVDYLRGGVFVLSATMLYTVGIGMWHSEKLGIFLLAIFLGGAVLSVGIFWIAETIVQDPLFFVVAGVFLGIALIVRALMKS